MKRRIHVLLFSLVLILSFQNCSQFKPDQGLLSITSKSAFSGNGGGYEGKPDGTYYYYVPNYTCEGSQSAASIVKIEDNQAYLYQNEADKCSDQYKPVPLADVGVSPFQNEYITITDELFKRYDHKPESIPDSIAEVLCRDNFENPTYEIVSHYDREKSQAMARVYTGHSAVADFPVSRILSSKDIQYASNEINFKIDLLSPLDVRKFSGYVKATSISSVFTGPITCVIGGSVDSSKWKFRAVTTGADAGPFHILSTGAVLFFSEISRTYLSSTIYTYIQHLLKISPEGVISDFTEESLGKHYSTTYRVPVKDKHISVFSAKSNTDRYESVFVYDWHNLKVKKLTNLKEGSPRELYSLKSPFVSKGRYLFYDTRIMQPGTTTANNLAIRVYDMNHDNIIDVIYNEADVYDYNVSYETDTLLIFWKVKNGYRNAMEVYNVKNGMGKDFKIKIPDNCILKSGQDYGFIKEETSFLASMVCDDGSKSVVELDIMSGDTKVVGLNRDISWSSENKNWLLLSSDVGLSLAYNTKTEEAINVPINPQMGYYSRSNSSQESLTNFSLSGRSAKIAFIEDKQLLYGFGGSDSNPTLYQINLNTGASVPTCESVLGKKLFVGSLLNQKVYLFTYDYEFKIYRFYYVKDTSECHRINEFPSEFPNVPKLLSTDIGFGLLLGNPLSAATSSYTREAVFVPMDGRPPLKFNHNTSGNWEMDIVPGLNRIVLRGPDVDGFVKIFFFDLN